MASLSVGKLKALVNPGRHGDGDGLYLNIAKGGSKSWILRAVIDGKRHDLGLGGYPKVSLAEARRLAVEKRTAVANGQDQVKEPEIRTFREAADLTFQAHYPRWRHSKTAKTWQGCLTSYVFPVFGDTPIDQVTQAKVLSVLSPIWATKPSMARKLRQRVRAVFAFAQAQGWIGLNPAGEVINAALPPMPGVQRHFRALPYDSLPAALRTVEMSSASLTARLCMKFLILTAARSGEARAATWDEIDLDNRSWTIPGSRMKAGIEHRVPLSDAALRILHKAAMVADGSGLVFPSLLRVGQPLSDMTLTKILRTTGLSECATVHGFRTTFRTWSMEETATPWAVCEAALAHSLGSVTERAYARSDLFDKRRPLMESWGAYVTEDDRP